MNFDSVVGRESRYARLAQWALIEGDRLLITAGVSAATFALTWTLIASGTLSVNPRSPIESILGSGVVAGLFSLISVTLTINQLVSSRVFGGLDTFQEKFEGGNDLRNKIAEISGHPSPPIDAAEFIAFIGETLGEQAVALRDERDRDDEEMGEEIASYVDDLVEYAQPVREVSNEMSPETVILTLAGPDFAQYLNRTDDLRSGRYEELTDAESDRLDSIAHLLSALTVFRQYFKTISLHQELARLSRQFVFIGFPAVMVALLAPLLYKSNPAAVLVPYSLPLIMSASLTVVVTPLVLLMVYMLRIATIFRYTVSVAPFVPPAEW
ncbi:MULTISPECIES: hypothetical protein [Halorussus]|uniref:hypothetical protein n=1 Tax=Halorussus TaxID=1070314 RepID=UPI0020A0695F|nr:hypothetical protein [Halorussus vallis]USZ77276.1 hypothetical protein NGM07_08075 [Halorussus vallis]